MANSASTIPGDVAWDDIIKALRNRQCVLFLGPDLLPGVSLFAELCRFLGGDTGDAPPPGVSVCYPTEELFLFADPGARMSLSFRLDDFYATWLPRFAPLYAQVAALPIPLIISTLPDDGLHRTFGEAGIAHQFHAYNFRGAAAAGILPPRQKRLIFNLFGDLHDANSLLLDHDDLFGFFTQFMGARKLSDTHVEIQEMLGSGSSVFLFLGFQFNKWYMQLLLRMLNPFKFKVRQYVLHPGAARDTRVFFARQFKMDFIDSLSPEAFLNELSARWQAAETTPAPATVTKQNMRDRLKLGETETVLQELEKLFGHDTATLHEITLLSARHSKLELATLKGTIGEADRQLESNRITEALLQLIERV